MPSPREQNKNLIRQAQSSNDKTFGLIIELATRLNTSDLDLHELVDSLVLGDDTVDYGRYENIIKPLLVAVYHSQAIEEALQAARRQI